MTSKSKKLTTAAIIAGLLGALGSTGLLPDWFPIKVSVEVGQRLTAPPATQEAPNAQSQKPAP